MSKQGIILGLCGFALAACGHQPAPETAAAADRDSTPCAQQDSGIALGHDVSRGPRYRVDSSGQVETLPPVPTVAGDTANRGCQAAADTSSAAPDTTGGAIPR
jgi:hypothetical protein